MLTILAHRGNTDGPDRRRENHAASLRDALDHGWGLEVDIRRAADGRFYLSHDPTPDVDSRLAEPFCADVRAHPEAQVALNIKECGYERDLVAFLADQNLVGQTYLFDMELIEAVPGESARLFRSIEPSLRIAARVSDRGESIDRALRIREASVIWLDEFECWWATAADVARLQSAGHIVHAVSPDLHGHSLAAARTRWIDFIDWGVDGICTDYPADLQKMLAATSRGAVA